MDTQREEAIANLYGLRAGLSTISQMYDNIQSIENQEKSNWNEKVNQVNSANEKVQKLEKENSYAILDIKDNKIHEIISVVLLVFFVVLTLAFIITLIYFKGLYLQTSNKAYVCGALFGIAVFCVFEFLLGWLMCSMLDDDLMFSDNVLCLVGTIIVLGGLGCSIATIVLFVRYADYKDIVHIGLIFGGVIFSCLGFISALLQTIFYSRKHKTYEKQKSAGDAELEKELQNKQEAIDDLQNEEIQIQKRRKQNIYPQFIRVNEIHTLFKKAFNHILDERDWKNLDLLIYYLETGRADSIKEALQLLDRELQTQRIENLIYNATKAIINTLNVEFMELQQSLGVFYNSLSSHLNEMNNELKNINSTIISSQAMNQALLAKMSITSSRMVDELSAIRFNAEYIRFNSI